MRPWSHDTKTPLCVRTYLLFGGQSLHVKVPGILGHPNHENAAMTLHSSILFQCLQLCGDPLCMLLMQHAELQCICLREQHTFLQLLFEEWTF